MTYRGFRRLFGLAGIVSPPGSGALVGLDVPPSLLSASDADRSAAHSPGVDTDGRVSNL